MSNYPFNIDTNAELPYVINNDTQIAADAINALREAMFNVEKTLGVSPNGSVTDVSTRLAVALNTDGTIKSSALTGLGLVTLPIGNADVGTTDKITENKLSLDYPTAGLNTRVSTLESDSTADKSFRSITGAKVEPHIAGASYKHNLSAINVDSQLSATNLNNGLFNKLGIVRDVTNSLDLLLDLNKDFVAHQKADSTQFDYTNPSSGTNPPVDGYYAHVAAGIYLNTGNFSAINPANNNLQSFAEAVDHNSLNLIGSRVQNLFSNGIPRFARATLPLLDGYGENIIPDMIARTYLLNSSASAPVDDIEFGDDIIEFNPSLSDNTFDAKFSLIKPGDIIRVNYGTVSASFIVDSKKYYSDGITKTFKIRINGINLVGTASATVRVDRQLFTENKYGVLPIAQVDSVNGSLNPSLIIGNPRGAAVLGIGFNPSLINATNYNLYLEIYQNGASSAVLLPAIDISGNTGATPGAYTLAGVIKQFNSAVRQPKYNYRFIAFEYFGEFGIMLADSYNNTSFSIVSGIISSGIYSKSLSESSYPNNIFSFTNTGVMNFDALGFGDYGAKVASPSYSSVYTTPEDALIPTRIFVPLKKNFYYVNGIEIDVLKNNINTSLDTYGDGYWPAQVLSRTLLSGRETAQYRVNRNLSETGLAIGKTIVAQSVNNSTFELKDCGRYVISDVQFTNCTAPEDGYTYITVYDDLHAQATYTSSSTSTNVNLYFNNDSVGFDAENVADTASGGTYRRYFEILVDSNGHSFSHERARYYTSYASTLPGDFNLINVSSKLKGYKYASIVYNRVILDVTINANNTISAYITSDGGSLNQGPIAIGKYGETLKVYTESYIDYIEIQHDVSVSLSGLPATTSVIIDIFPTLEQDQENFIIASCLQDQVTLKITNILDKRQFGNVSEKNLTNSALEYIGFGEKYLHENGVIKGFDLTDGGDGYTIYLSGGIALVNGKFVTMNTSTIHLPTIREFYLSADYLLIQWAICVNDKSEIQIMPLLDYIVGTPSDTNRIFNAHNLVTDGYYKLQSVTFGDLVAKRKDLTLLHIVTTSN